VGSSGHKERGNDRNSAKRVNQAAKKTIERDKPLYTERPLTTSSSNPKWLVDASKTQATYPGQRATAKSDDGLQPGEGMFLACSFWLVDAYVMLGRVDEAKALFERLIRLCNDIGLMSEQYDPEAKRLSAIFRRCSHTSHWSTAHAISTAARVNCPAHLNAP